MDKGEKHGVGRAILLFLIVVVMFCFALANYTVAQDKTFDANGFYKGKSGERQNPKEVYDAIYSNILAAENACRKEMNQASDPRMAGNGVYWVVDGVDITKESLGDVLSIKPYDSTHDKIVSPAEVTFLNSNVMLNGDTVYIEAQLGTGYVIQWSPVRAWWCHIGRGQNTGTGSGRTQHTDICGLGGRYSVCMPGWIIGQATEETEVKIWKLLESGGKQQISLAEYFFPAE